MARTRGSVYEYLLSQNSVYSYKYVERVRVARGALLSPLSYVAHWRALEDHSLMHNQSTNSALSYIILVSECVEAINFTPVHLRVFLRLHSAHPLLIEHRLRNHCYSLILILITNIDGLYYVAHRSDYTPHSRSAHDHFHTRSLCNRACAPLQWAALEPLDERLSGWTRDYDQHARSCSPYTILESSSPSIQLEFLFLKPLTVRF